MTDFNQFHDTSEPAASSPEKLPDMINVLTILTFIGCAMGLLQSLYGYLTICKSIRVMEESIDKIGSDNFMASFLNSSLQAAQRQCELRLPILLLSLAGVIFCFTGALKMRKLQKSGFYFYLIGQLAAVTSLLIVGGLGTIFIIFPVIFVILYATQLKHMRA